MCLRMKAFALTGRGDSTMWKTQGVASLALGYVHHWAFSPSLLNPKLESTYIKPYPNPRVRNVTLRISNCKRNKNHEVVLKHCRYKHNVYHWLL